ncbi:sigma factor-like helix-turn-helix DNA-binding protein [Streptomyces venezuelae]|uniref:sigma factor-like helix-turn-helix DNA-binding protein n=1 Tax=Streptomyces venezuelae TaxID=54571 RepID=UPI0036392D3B
MDENAVAETLPMAYRLLGSREEAEEAVRDASGRPDPTAAVARACLARLRSRETHREHPWDPWDPWAAGQDRREGTGEDPLDGLTPPERLAYVLHDEFSVPYEEIAPVLERTPAATRQLAGRARYRLRETEEMPDPDLHRQRAVVEAFLTAARNGDAAALHDLLDPEVVLRADATAVRAGLPPAHGPGAVSETLANRVSTARKALVDGAAGLACPPEGDPETVFTFTVLEDHITAVDALADKPHLTRLNLQLQNRPGP